MELENSDNRMKMEMSHHMSTKYEIICITTKMLEIVMKCQVMLSCDANSWLEMNHQ